MKFAILNRWSGKVQFTAEINCDEGEIRNVKIGLAVKWAYLSHANLSHADLSHADLRGAVLRGANLSRADLSHADLRGAVLRGAVLRGANLSHADLSHADLRDADLSDADLSGADLRGADLRGIPVVSDIDAKMLASIEANKATGKNGLKMSTWHGDDNCDETNWCETTHCRAGYAICLAGAAGFELERKVGPDVAGALIYAASRPGKPVPNFYATEDEAMTSIRNDAAAVSKKEHTP